MKKLMSVLLAAVMILGLFVTASAFSSPKTYEIRYGETLTVEVPKTNKFPFYSMVTFVPAESGRYVLRSHSTGDADPCCMLLETDTLSIFISEDDDFDSYDFSLVYDFEAGKTYTFALSDNNSATSWEISLGCGHIYENGKCVSCDYVCPHDKVNDYLCYCECGTVYLGSEISLGEETLIELDIQDEYSELLRFIPEESGAYTLRSVSEDIDPCAFLIDADGDFLIEADDEDDLNFVLSYQFEAGETYYFRVLSYDDAPVSYTVKLEKAVHLAEDGSTHELQYVIGTDSTCTEVGYTDGLFCEECDIFISGHEETEPWSHFDLDRDGLCDECSTDITEGCDHICHSDSKLISAFWRLLCFFFKLLGKNWICDCGYFHY